MTVKRSIGTQIDQSMEQASDALIARKYFAAERLAAGALELAISTHDFARAARIINPLQEARRQKRDLAIDANCVFVITTAIAEDAVIEPGAYVFVPPRVAQEARILRARADQAEVPIITVTREPTTKMALCPIVCVGTTTLRAYVPEPAELDTRPKKSAKPKKTPEAPTVFENAFGRFSKPSLAWVLSANEALGDAGIEAVSVTDPFKRVTELYLRLQAQPDHEKLHQRLREACEFASHEAMVNPAAVAKLDQPEPLDIDEEI